MVYIFQIGPVLFLTRRGMEKSGRIWSWVIQCWHVFERHTTVLQIWSSGIMPGQPTPPTETSAWCGRIKGNQWLISRDHKAVLISGGVHLSGAQGGALNSPFCASTVRGPGLRTALCRECWCYTSTSEGLPHWAGEGDVKVNSSFTHRITPWKINGWNLQITHLERKMIFQSIIFRCKMLIFGGVFWFW